MTTLHKTITTLEKHICPKEIDDTTLFKSTRQPTLSILIKRTRSTTMKRTSIMEINVHWAHRRALGLLVLHIVISLMYISYLPLGIKLPYQSCLLFHNSVGKSRYTSSRSKKDKIGTEHHPLPQPEENVLMKTTCGVKPCNFQTI